MSIASMFFGVLFFIIALVIPLSSRIIRFNPSVYKLIFFGLLFHVFVSLFLAVFYETLLPHIGFVQASIDFYNDATKMVDIGLHYHWGIGIYNALMAIIYMIFGKSWFLGSQVSVFIFSLTTIVFCCFLKHLVFVHHRKTLLLYVLWPAGLILMSIPMRECFEVLFFMLATYFSVLFLEKEKWKYLLMMIASAIAMSLFHKALPVLAIFVLFLTIVFWLYPRKNVFYKSKKILIVVFFILCAFFFLVIEFSHLSPTTGYVFSSNVISHIEKFRSFQFSNSLNAHAEYGIMIDSTSFLSLLFSFVKIYSYYIFYPFFWRFHSPGDVVSFLASIARVILIVCAIIHCLKVKGRSSINQYFLLIIFFFTTLMWSMGTTNYGISFRHNLVTDWLIILLGGPTFFSFFNSCLVKLKIFIKRLW